MFNSNGVSLADIAAVTGNNRNNDGMWGDGAWWLKCFLLIDLKTTQISHQDVGQMDMHVRMYDELKRTDGDNPTIGLILCSKTSEDMGNSRPSQCRRCSWKRFSVL